MGSGIFISRRDAVGVMSHLSYIKEPRQKAAADDDDDWISWHDPLIGGTCAEL